VDGAGTKQALFDAIKTTGTQMNPNEQFVFWASDHGNRERTERALNRLVTDPVKQDIPPFNYPKKGIWKCDRKLVKQAGRPDAERHLSLIVDPLFPIAGLDSLSVYFNGEILPLKTVGDIEGLNPCDPLDLDALELMYEIPKTMGFRRKNRVQIEWIDPGTFEPFMIYGLQIGVSVSELEHKGK
jgi:hypothetical protein